MKPRKAEGRSQKAKAKTAGAIGLTLLLACLAKGATLRGVVLDAATRQPVAYAAVYAPSLEAGTTADSNGVFALALVTEPALVAIEVSRVGYEPRVWDQVNPARPATFYLRPSAVDMQGVTVSAFRSPVPLARSGPVSVIEQPYQETRGRLSLAEALAMLPSVTARDYGNLTILGLRGASAEQTLVLLDGVRLNSAQDNLFELTTLPLTLAERVEVVRGGSSALYGANSIGGLVNVITPEPGQFSALAVAGVGSRGKRYLAALHTNRSGELGYAIAANLHRTGDRFPYRDAHDSLRERVNSDLSSQDLMAKGVFARGNYRVSLLGGYNTTGRGEPGRIQWPSDSARMEDHRGVAHLGYELQEADNARLEAKLFRHQMWRHYWNPDPFSWVNDTHQTTVTGVMLKQTIHLTGWATAIAGLEGAEDRFQSTSIGTPSRRTGSGWAEARLRWGGFDFAPMARFDWLNDRRQQPDSTLTRSNTRVINPKLAVNYQGTEWLSLYTSIGRSFRTPTFNELYWPQEASSWPPTTYVVQGNPRLKPEWATSVDAGASLRYGSFLTARLGLWRSFLTDLIQWQSAQRGDTLLTQPVNLDTATISGAELELGFATGHAGVKGHATYMLARSHGMDLIYRPRLGLSVAHWVGWDVARLNWDVRSIGPRYTTPDSLAPNDSNSLPGFMVLDLGFALSPRWRGVKTALRGGVRNLLDKHYQMMRGYPVPGRNWYAEIGLSL